MKISIGILAHNEAASIHKTLESLFQQSLLKNRIGTQNYDVEVICVPNGCTDHTADRCRDVLTQLAQRTNTEVLLGSPPNVAWNVCELAQSGKPNALNHYVHQFSDRQADYLILMDADIWFAQEKTLESLVDLLERESHVWVAVDQPIKDVIFKPNKNLIEHLSTFVSELSGSNNAVWLCGQLYCARAEILRNIYMPTELSADDSFLYQMVTTDGLETEPRPDRIARAPQASHVFETYTNPKQLIKHERWLIIANITNSLIFEHVQQTVKELKSLPSQETYSVSTLFRTWDQQNPQWVTQLIQKKLTSQLGWVSPPAFLARRFTNLRYKPWWKASLLLPLATAALIIDLITLYTANQELSKGLKSNSNTAL